MKIKLFPVAKDYRGYAFHDGTDFIRFSNYKKYFSALKKHEKLLNKELQMLEYQFLDKFHKAKTVSDYENLILDVEKFKQLAVFVRVGGINYHYRINQILLPNG